MNKRNLKNRFENFIIENNVIGFFKDPILLKSGRESYWYVNWRNISSDVFLIDQLTDYVIEYILSLQIEPDCVYGVPEGATKLGILTQYKLAIRSPDYKKNQYVLSMGRGKPKIHGEIKDRYYIGVPKGNIIILEDVTTTGSSLITTIENLSDLDVKIIATIGLTNRNELREDGLSVKEKIEELGYKYYSMSNALDLLPQIYKIDQPGTKIKEKIESYFSEYGTSKLKLSN